MVVLDTSALLFWTLDPRQLSRKASRAIEISEHRVLSSISLWEVGIKVERGRLVLPLSVREFSKRLMTVERVEVLPVDPEIWLANLELEWAHRDPADRTIVATAQVRGCPLITSDATIRVFYTATIW